MKTRTRIQKKKKLPFSSVSESEDHLFQARPFADESEGAEIADLNLQNDQEEPIGHNFSQIQVSDRTAIQPKVSLGVPGHHPKLKAIKDKQDGEVLDAQAISQYLQTLPDWTIIDAKLNFSAEYPDLVEMENFVNSVKKAQQEIGHQAELKINENQVSITLVTHEVGGLTEKDFTLAKAISQLTQVEENNSQEA